MVSATGRRGCEVRRPSKPEKKKTVSAAAPIFPHLLAAVRVFDLVGLDVEHDATHLHCQFHALWGCFKTLHLCISAPKESTQGGECAKTKRRSHESRLLLWLFAATAASSLPTIPRRPHVEILRHSTRTNHHAFLRPGTQKSEADPKNYDLGNAGRSTCTRVCVVDTLILALSDATVGGVLLG